MLCWRGVCSTCSSSRGYRYIRPAPVVHFRYALPRLTFPLHSHWVDCAASAAAADVAGAQEGHGASGGAAAARRLGGALSRTGAGGLGRLLVTVSSGLGYNAVLA